MPPNIRPSFTKVKTILQTWVPGPLEANGTLSKRTLSKNLQAAGIPSSVTRGMWLMFNHLLRAFEGNTYYKLPLEKQVFWLETYLRIYLNTEAGKVTSLKPSQVKKSNTANELDSIFTVWVTTCNFERPWHIAWNRLEAVLVNSGYPRPNVKALGSALECVVSYASASLDVPWRTQRELLRLWFYQLTVSFKK